MIPWQKQAAEVTTVFQEVAGAIEFQTDATKVNTTQGWRDLKIAAFLKRPCGAAAPPEAWPERLLPAPTARVVGAEIGPSDDFARTWRRETQAVLDDLVQYLFKQRARGLRRAEGRSIGTG